jgi:hypothetical protein
MLERAHRPERRSLSEAFHAYWFPPHRTNEIIAHEWLSQKILWDAARPSVEEGERSRIDEMFPTTPVWESGPQEWYHLNATTQEVGKYLTNDQLNVEYFVLLRLAKVRKLTSADVHDRNAELFKSDVEANLPKKRAAYLSVLDDLQRRFINTRYNRGLRTEVARRLLKIGMLITLVAILLYVTTYFSFRISPLAAGAFDANKGLILYSANPFFGLEMVIAFGLFGAFFSRVLMFQTQSSKLGFSDVMKSYQSDLLFVRLLCGTIGAVVFYFFLRSGIIAGGAFPDLSKITIGAQRVWMATPSPNPDTAATKLDLTGLTVMVPTVELAKLAVWSFLAGFSERLVPDALAQTVAKKDDKTP